MIRPISIMCILQLVAAVTGADGDRVVMQDGRVRPIDDAALVNAGDTTWPGWIALWRSSVSQPPERDNPGSMLVLDDGQSIEGGFNVVQDALWWRSRSLGPVQVDLERVASIGPTPRVTESTVTRDHVALINGDHVEGFVNAIEAGRGVEIETGTGTATSTRTWYDLSKVASIRLTPRPRVATGWRIWLRDGTVVDVDAWRRDGARVLLQGMHLPGSAPRVTVDWEEVSGIQRNGSPVIPLAGLVWKASDVGDTPRLAPAHSRVDAATKPLDVRPIDLHGPGTFMARVPEGRWAIDLTLTAPPMLVNRVACTVQVLADDRELARLRIEAGTPPQPMHALLQGGDLRVVISDAAHGAFGAAVRLDGAMLIPVSPDAAAPTTAPTSVPGSQAGSKDPG